jgi:O-methyltransferase involved in polyketide biosynthesis
MPTRRLANCGLAGLQERTGQTLITNTGRDGCAMSARARASETRDEAGLGNAGDTGQDLSGLVSEDDLAAVQADFPGYQIWREILPGRDRFIVRSLVPGLSPHTLVTDDLAELRDVLEPVTPPQPEGFTVSRPNLARMYAHWLGGKDSFEADRVAADSVLVRFPEVAEVARANRAFLARALRHVAQQGVCQFIDFGAGLPTSQNLHEIAREHVPGARVVYLDHDPVVLSHARAIQAIDENIGVVAGDLREPAVSMADPVLRGLISRDEPVCVILGCVLHFLTAEEADAAVEWLRQWMVSGSYLVISAGTTTGTDPELLQQLQAAVGDAAPVTGRTAGEIEAWFDGLAVARPGVVDLWDWRPDSRRRPVQSRARVLAGVGRKSLPEAGARCEHGRGTSWRAETS